VTPNEGVDRFLGGLIVEDLLEPDELQRVIDIGARRSPSAAFNAIASDYQLRMKYSDRMVLLALQKGARWLAMLRRDEGQAVFEAKCHELRTLIGQPAAKPLAVSHRHIARHFVGSGELGASIDRWSNTEEMLADPAIQAVLEQALQQLNPENWEAQNVIVELPFEVGFEGKVRLGDIPKSARVWQEVRGDYIVNVTNATPPRTRHLTFVFGQKPDVWLLITVFSGSTPSRPLSDQDWWQDWAFYDLR
jgi:hypothetical protein